MRIFGGIMQIHQFLWSLESHRQQRLAWRDAEQARVARAQAEARADAQLQSMMIANPSGQLGRSALDDIESLRESGLL